MNVLITGASGFVGVNLITYLTNLGIETSQLSVRHNSLLPDELLCDHIIHLAGKAHDLKKVSSPSDYYDANFELTKLLYDKFLNSNAKTFIFISSVKAAADEVNGVLTEETLPTPATHYGKSKLMGEDYIKSQVLPKGKSYFILRPCMIHGPGNKGNLNLLYRLVEKRIPYPLAAFNNKRSFLSIENLCFVIHLLITRDGIDVGIYNLADDEALSTNEVVQILSASLNMRPLLWKIPPYLIKSIAKIGDKLHLPLTSERLEKLTENYIVSNMKLKNHLGIHLPKSSREGLMLTAASFKQ